VHVGDLGGGGQHALGAALPGGDLDPTHGGKDLGGLDNGHPVEIDRVEQGIAKVVPGGRIILGTGWWTIPILIDLGVITTEGIVPVAVVKVRIVFQGVGQRVGRQELEVFQAEGFSIFKERVPLGHHVDDGSFVGPHVHLGANIGKANEAPAAAQISGEGFVPVAVAVQVQGVGGEGFVVAGVDNVIGITVGGGT